MPDATATANPSDSCARQAFAYHHRVTYADCTVGNHIYYARYLPLLEAARGDLIRQSGASLLNWQERGYIFPVIECRLRYKQPARYDDQLTIEVWLTETGRLRLNFGYRILNQAGQLVLEAETFHICAGLDEKPPRAPEELTASLARFHHPALLAKSFNA